TSSSASYITANILTSTQTFYGVTFNNSGGLSNLYNITVAGSEASLSWLMKTWSGPIGGAPYTLNDLLTKINWNLIPPGMVSPTFLAVSSFSVTAQWVDGGNVAKVNYTLQACT